MTVLAEAMISRNFRVTIPKEVREHLKLAEGNKLIFFTVAELKERVCFRRVNRNPYEKNLK